MLSYPLFSTFATIFLLSLVASCIFTNLSIYSIVSKGAKHVTIKNTRKQFKPNSDPGALLSVIEEVRGAYVRDLDPVPAPINVTVEERMAWFKEKQAEFEIIRSDKLSRKFAFRASEFFDGGCDVRFFMTWISPVRAFGRREFLALESIFKAHPFGCVMILSRSMDCGQGRQVLKPLAKSGYRVVAITPDFPFLFKDTPAEAWFGKLKKGNVDPGVIPLAQNLSNLLRLAVLYKYGGVYLDTDVIVLKKLSDLKNAIGAQTVDEKGNWSRLNNAVLIFDRKHPLILKFIKEFAHTFDGNRWGHNGPYLVSRVVEKALNKRQFNFTVLPPMAFYPVNWINIGSFFRRPKKPAELKWTEAKLRQLSGEAYAVHLWNRQSSSLRIEEGSIIERLTSDHCLFCEHTHSV